MQKQLDETAKQLGASRDEYRETLADVVKAQDQLAKTKAAVTRLRKRVVQLEATLGIDDTTNGGCDPSYPSVCIPMGSEDYDCAGGSGDPPFIEGPLTVLPPDPHRLDGYDNDGVGCESG
jgi:hypothetical protein